MTTQLPSRVLVALAALLVVALPATADAKPKHQKAKPLPPFDYVAAASRLSQPEFPQTVREATTVEAADGEHLYVEIVRPDPAVYGERRFPVVLEASPYHGTLA